MSDFSVGELVRLYSSMSRSAGISKTRTAISENHTPQVAQTILRQLPNDLTKLVGRRVELLASINSYAPVGEFGTVVEEESPTSTVLVELNNHRFVRAHRNLLRLLDA